jgi:hypothetical protein
MIELGKYDLLLEYTKFIMSLLKIKPPERAAFAAGKKLMKVLLKQ